MIVFYVFSTFLAVVLPAEAAYRNDRGNQEEDYYNDNVTNSSLFGYNPDSAKGQNDNNRKAATEGYSAPVMTRGYVLVSGDTLDSVAKRYNLSVEGLRRLNQDRFFKNGFDGVKEGDTIYVPLAPVSEDMARYLEGQESKNGAIASLATRAESFLTNGVDSREIQSMAKGYFSGKANNAINQWFNQFGTAR
ncbi:LysM domain-containing protein, partial [uncultured Bartonella sp.]|uniref:LysM peptidoglycan-binding domain-containing protein n=1 Tax=uncultured Bartonella sp. TaxID=104108 RepID=UPI00262C46E3